MGLKKTIGVYPGTFDPLTNGHVDIVDRALKTFDEIHIVVAQSARKNVLVPLEDRVKLIKQVVGNRKNVIVNPWQGLVIEYAQKNKAKSLIRGLRAASDFEYEFMMAAMNRELDPRIETVFLMTGENLFFVSSTMVKELIQFGGDSRPYVPKQVYEYLKKIKLS